jgi:hypothetical protein
MPLYKISRNDAVGYDEYDAFVVKAKSRKAAMELIWKEHPYGNSWSNDVSFEILKPGDKDEIILGSFNAG